MLRPFTTYKVFLDKFYPLEKFTTTDGIPDWHLILLTI
jgi:hypothetical protein